MNKFIIDTHAHLNFDIYKDTLKTVLNAALKQNITKFIIPSTDYKSITTAIDISKKYSNCYSAVGIHPTTDTANQDSKNIYNFLRQTICDNSDCVVAIGETGLDLYQNTIGIVSQIERFNKHIKLSLSTSLPLIIHNRLTTAYLIDALSQSWDKALEFNMVFHCMSPNINLLDFAIKHKIYMGVDGDVTYNSEKSNFVKNIPLDLLLLETDSPYLTPHPHRKVKRFPNEPKNLIHTISYLSKVINIKECDLIDQTTQNAKNLFSI